MGSSGDKQFRPFGPASRLHQPKEFAAVLASPSRVRGGCFEVRYCSIKRVDGQRSGARLGLVIPKRLARRAVLRNQIKRLAREAFRQVIPELPLLDVVLRLTKPALSSDTKLDAALCRTWRREIDALLAGLPR